MEPKCNYWNKDKPKDDDDDDAPPCEHTAPDTAEPLCSLSDAQEDPFAATTSSDPFSQPTTTGTAARGESGAIDSFMTSAEETIVNKMYSEEDCSNEELPTFWLDMCTEILTNSSSVVNLQLNPERYTGYNGSHIWSAIYDENCLQRTGSPSNICYEERVLYRLLSGMHAETNIHISRFYHAPSKRKNRTEWEPNIDFFNRQFAGHPERLKNLNFAFVVLLRAISRASSFLSSHPYDSADDFESTRTRALMHRLLESKILDSCSTVFGAFDETLLFREQQSPWWSLKKQFKSVFHNVSRVIDCVTCEKCKLHAKVTMLGLGTALKMLLLPIELIPPSISRDELVALINTVGKFSSAIHYAKELQLMHEGNVAAILRAKGKMEPPLLKSSTIFDSLLEEPTVPSSFDSTKVELMMDTALHHLAALRRRGLLPIEMEIEAVGRALGADSRVLLLCKHFGNSPSFASHLKEALDSPPAPLSLNRLFEENVHGADSMEAHMNDKPRASSAHEKMRVADAIVVGGGAAGMAAAVNMLDMGARVILIDKEKRLGGNSAKASSGINACCPPHSRASLNSADAIDAFAADTARSAQREAGELISILTNSSEQAIAWLRQRAGLDLSKIAQLGGHSYARTHRPNNGMIGAEIVFALQRTLKEFEKSGSLKILTGCRVSRLLHDEHGAVEGVSLSMGDGCQAAEVLKSDNFDKGFEHKLGSNDANVYAWDTVLATGGYANDRTENSLLMSNRPDLYPLPTTNGPWATGDGMKMAMAIGAGTVDMEHVQVHPTGFVDPSDPNSSTKVLCGEMMRGVGGILLTPDGHRFVDELKPRDKVVSAEKESGASEFTLLLNDRAATEAGKHTELYVHKGLLVKLEGTSALAEWMLRSGNGAIKAGDVRPLEKALNATLHSYNAAAAAGSDEFGKSAFHNVPFDTSGTMFAGKIVPVLHYTMGGIRMNAQGAVLRPDGSPIPHLHAAGEVTGGVHGANRLGGNSLLECTVFGTIVGQKLGAIAAKRGAELAGLQNEQFKVSQSSGVASSLGDSSQDAHARFSRNVSLQELATHIKPDDCWVSLYGTVYDFSSYLDEHPGGGDSILRLAGTDGTAAFETVHNQRMLEEMSDLVVGQLL